LFIGCEGEMANWTRKYTLVPKVTEPQKYLYSPNYYYLNFGCLETVEKVSRQLHWNSKNTHRHSTKTMDFLEITKPTVTPEITRE
jgi:hypothetical protein